MNVVLIGYRGAGKSTIGKKLADRLWQRFVDVDELIVRKAGKSIREIFEDGGEMYFRDLETAALWEALQIPDHVLALGGGSLTREENRQMVQRSGDKVVYLRCDPKELARRIEGDLRTRETRPSLTPLGGGIEEIRLKVAEREPFYRALMHVELDVTNLTIEEAVAYVGRLL